MKYNGFRRLKGSLADHFENLTQLFRPKKKKRRFVSRLKWRLFYFKLKIKIEQTKIESFWEKILESRLKKEIDHYSIEI